MGSRAFLQLSSWPIRWLQAAHFRSLALAEGILHPSHLFPKYHRFSENFRHSEREPSAAVLLIVASQESPNLDRSMRSHDLAEK